MKIKTNITETREVDIELPVFRKEIGYGSTSYLAVIEASHVHTIYSNKEAGHTTVTTCEFWIKETDVVKAVNTWEEVTEEEFLEAHETALKSLSLRPVLCEIDREIEDELNNKNDIENVL